MPEYVSCHSLRACTSFSGLLAKEVLYFSNPGRRLDVRGRAATQCLLGGLLSKAKRCLRGLVSPLYYRLGSVQLKVVKRSECLHYG
jgi:hypothetical protein